MSLEWRVTFSYLIAFAVVLAIFGVAVHAAFTIDVGRDVSNRLTELTIAGRRALEVEAGHTYVDAGAVQILSPTNEGIAWYDGAGRKLRARGAVTQALRTPSDFRTRTESVPRLIPADPDAPATVFVAVSYRPSRHLLQRLDLGLLLGFFVALAAAGVGGLYLARRSLVRVVTTIRTLRDFTADAAHELRGPLAALESNAGASLRDAGDLPAAHRQRLETIADTASGMTRTVEDLLLLARAETPIERDLYAIDLDARVTAAVDLRRTLAAEKHVALEAAPCTARIYGNPSEIDRILGNLLDNALRYTPAGGSVHVACTVERSGVAVRIRDTGVGIASDDLPRIFERFWRADSVRAHQSGTGLGLAIVRALARRHGGEVFVASTPQRGSEFTVWLPSRPPRPRDPLVPGEP